MLKSGTNIARVRPVKSIMGIVDVPSDKSIAHRAALFSAIADGTSRLVDYPESDDPASTLACLRGLGVDPHEQDEILVVEGRGLFGLQTPRRDLDCGNSGTTMRLLSGILAGQPFASVLTGDASLSVRDMSRIAEPLGRMGADIALTDGHAPVRISGGGGLQGIEYELPVASAQVKSAVLLAGLYANGETSVIENVPSRDHTERMLGLPCVDLGGRRIITIEGGKSIRARTWTIPRDFSAAAYFLVAAAILPDSALRIPRVGLNPSRTGLLDVLMAMGARIYIENERTVGGESVGDLVVFGSPLSGVEIGGDVVPNILDEIPILAVAASMADGVTVIREAGELRRKESDRISAMAVGLDRLGIDVMETDDGMEITGGRLSGGMVDSFGDHRIAMAFGVAGLAASERVSIRGADCTSVSYPGFWQALARIAYGEAGDAT